MRLLIYEHLTAIGGIDLPDGGSPSLFREGLAMLGAVLEDFSALSEIQAVVPISPRLDWSPPSSLFRTVSLPGDSIDDSLDECLQGVDAALLIAPEFGGILETLTSRLERSGIRNLGSNSPAVHLAGDKLQTAQRLTEHAVPTIPTWKLYERGEFDSDVWNRLQSIPHDSLLIKPRFGAGSQEMFVFQQLPSKIKLKELIDSSRWLTDAIIQPYIPSIPLSVAVWCAGNDRDYHPFPAGEQLLADQTDFAYQGGRIPPCQPAWTSEFEYEIQCLAVAACRAIPGLRGYAGVDLLLPIEENPQPLVCEINPRLTTGYLGYRAISRSNLASQWLDFSPTEIGFRKDSLRFSCDGTIELLD